MIECLFYHRNRAGLQQDLPLTRLPFSAFTFLLEGKMNYRVNGELICLSPGDAVFLPEGCERFREKTGKTEHISFHFHTTSPVELPVFLPGTLTHSVRRLLAAFDEIAETAPDPADERYGAFLALIIAELSVRVRNEKEDPLVRSIRRYLYAHLDQKVTLADVGRAVHFSPNHCQALFRANTGRSIIDTLLELRMKEAASLIASGEYRLQEVARRVGFEDYNYFSRVFRARCGASPTRYRRLFS